MSFFCFPVGGGIAQDFFFSCSTGISLVSVGSCHLSCENVLYCPRKWVSSLQPQLSCLGLRASSVWWNVVGCGSPGLCVLSTNFLQPEAASHTASSERSQLPLPGSLEIGGGRVDGQSGFMCGFVQWVQLQ